MQLKIVRTPHGVVSAVFTLADGKPAPNYTQAAVNLFGEVHPDDVNLLKEMLTPSDVKVPTQTAELRVRDDTGTYHWQMWKVTFNRLPTGSTLLDGVALDESEQAQAAGEILRDSQLYDMVSKLNQMLIRARTKLEIYQGTCQIAVDTGRFMMAWIGVIDPLVEMLEPVTHYGKEEGYLKCIPPISVYSNRIGMGPSGQSAREGRINVNNDIADQADHNYDHFRSEALKRGYQLISRGVLKGVLNLYHGEAGFFNDKVQTLLTELKLNLSFGIGAIDDARDFRDVNDTVSDRAMRYKDLIKDMRIGSLMQGPQTEILAWNQAALDLLGVTEDQLMGRTSMSPEWNVVHEDGSDFPGDTHPVSVAAKTSKPVQGIVMGVYHPIRKERVWLLVDAHPKVDADGNVIHVLCYFNDITRLRNFQGAIGRKSDKM